MSAAGNHGFQGDFEELFEASPCGLLVMDRIGSIVKANARLAEWLGYPNSDDLMGRKFSGLLSTGGTILYETHLVPLLRMRGGFEEMALEFITHDGIRVPTLVNARERQDVGGKPLFTVISIFKAADRHVYEKGLMASKALAEGELSDERGISLLREQFIAVLGHDLRNPLSAIITGTALLAERNLDEKSAILVGVMKESSNRMKDLIADVMDYARGRLGSGMVLRRHPVDLQPLLRHIVEEIQIAHPGRKIHTQIELVEVVDCDAARISQILSNLLANALAHGCQDTPVVVNALIQDDCFELAVANQGAPIPLESLATIFQPFTKEGLRPSQNGLGLGLYIASQIATAHGGDLRVVSNVEETRFTFLMPHVKAC